MKYNEKLGKVVDHILFYIIPLLLSVIAVGILLHLNDKVPYEHGTIVYIGIALLSVSLLVYSLVAISLLLNMFSGTRLPREGSRRLNELLDNNLHKLIIRNIFLRLMIIQFITLTISISVVITNFSNIYVFAILTTSIIWSLWYLFLAYLAMYWIIKAIYREKP